MRRGNTLHAQRNAELYWTAYTYRIWESCSETAQGWLHSPEGNIYKSCCGRYTRTSPTTCRAHTLMWLISTADLLISNREINWTGKISRISCWGTFLIQGKLSQDSMWGGGVAGNWRSYADSASLHTTRENDSQTDCGALIWALIDKPGWDCEYYCIPYNRMPQGCSMRWYEEWNTWEYMHGGCPLFQPAGPRNIIISSIACHPLHVSLY